MTDILYARTFLIIGGMLLITSITARINKAFETATEMWITIILTFAFLFSILIFANSFPLNIFLVTIFAGLIGWEIGPTIEYFGERYRMKRHFRDKGAAIKRGHKYTANQVTEFRGSFNVDQYRSDWHNIIFQALMATTLAVFASASVVFLTKTDFSFLGIYLFISLAVLVIMGLLNVFFFRSPLFSLIKAYFGAIIFTLYLFYDFDRLEKMAKDDTWATAIDISVNIYLDIINLFLDLLEILSDSD